MLMSRKLFQCLKDEFNLEVQDDYSGMMTDGSKCFGVVADNLVSCVTNLTECLEELLDDEDFSKEVTGLLDSSILDDPAVDNLGLDFIFYYPEIQVDDVDEGVISDENA